MKELQQSETSLPSFNRVSDFNEYVEQELRHLKVFPLALVIIKWAFRQGLQIGSKR